MNPSRLGSTTERISESSLDRIRQRWHQEGGTPSILAMLIKVDLQRRFQHGERPAVASYLQAIPELNDHSDQVLSLIYEEFCLREEVGEAPNPDSFCERYEPWRDSLESQLNYHRLLSQAAGGMPRLPTFPEPGDHFLRFHLRSILGQGGAARVFLADDEDLGGRRSALKVSPDRGEEPSIMGRLQHRHIMPVLTVVREPETGLRGLCMPYRPGCPLDQILRRMEPIPPTKRTAQTLLDQVAPEDGSASFSPLEWEDFPGDRDYPVVCAWIAMTLASALDHAHGRGILHRDVKPANILLSAPDGPLLLDFNLAHDPNAPERAESALRGGTLPYMAPEQLEAFRDPERWEEVGPTADLYALGLVLRELLTGKRPEAPPAETPLPRTINDLLILRATGWPSTRIENPATPHALDAIIGRCLAFDPDDRYPSASVLVDDLRAFIDRRPMVFADNPNFRERTINWVRRNRQRLITAALVIALVPAGLVVRGEPTDLADLLISASFADEKSRSDNFDEVERARFREEARRGYLEVIRRDPNEFRAYNGLASIAFHEGKIELHDRLIDRAITAYESRAENRQETDKAATEFRSYIAQLHRAKVLKPLGTLKLLIAGGKEQTPEAAAAADELKSMRSHLQLALKFSEACPGQVKMKTYITAVTTFGLLANQSRAPGEKEEYQARMESAIEEIEALNAQGVWSDSFTSNDLQVLRMFAGFKSD